MLKLMWNYPATVSDHNQVSGNSVRTLVLSGCSCCSGFKAPLNLVFTPPAFMFLNVHRSLTKHIENYTLNIQERQLQKLVSAGANCQAMVCKQNSPENPTKNKTTNMVCKQNSPQNPTKNKTTIKILKRKLLSYGCKWMEKIQAYAPA